METEISVNGEGNESRKKTVRKNLELLYATRAGEQGLDRDFGLDMDGLDLPSPRAKALLAAEYVRKTQKYEPRAKVVRVEWPETEDGRLKAKVVVKLV